MEPVIHPLFLLHPDPEFREYVAEAARDPFLLTTLPDWKALRKALRGAPSGSVAVVDPFAGSGEELSPALRELLLHYPSVPVAAALEVTPERIRELRTLGEWRVAAVIRTDRDRPAAIRSHVRMARMRLVHDLLTRARPQRVSIHAYQILDAAAEVAARGGGADELVAHLGLTRRILTRRCARAGLPPPRRLLAWVRVLRIAHLLDDPGRSAASAALASGYLNDPDVRELVHAFLGAGIAELRERGAFATASGLFRNELSERYERGNGSGV